MRQHCSLMAKADRFQAPSLFDLLQRANSVLEFLIRWIFVNLPTYLLANFPELDRISIVVMAYFLLQVVGLCWGVLLNAGFSLACRITGVLPYLSTGPLFTSGNADGEFTTSVSVQMISTFYVSYASVRSVIGFASSIFNLALDSINNFPKNCTLYARPRDFPANPILHLRTEFAKQSPQKGH